MDFPKAPNVELGRIPLAPGQTAGKAREGVPGWVRARLNVDVALQEPISWEEGWRSCVATQGTNLEHKRLCSAPMGIAKYPSLAASARGGFCPFLPKQICLGWNIVAASQLGQEHGPGAGAPALSCILTSGSLQIPNLVKISAESPGSCGGVGHGGRS